MRFAGQLIPCIAAVTWLVFTVRADDLAIASNPYTTITERNIFSLVPIPEPGPAVPEVVTDPPPKITINGMMTIFGKPQVLFKFTPKAPPGQPAKEVSLVLGEGERQEDIEVTKIDMRAHMASFINHGKAEDVALSDAAKLTAPVSAPAAGTGIPMVGAGGGGIPMPTMPSGFPPGRGKGRGAAPTVDPNAAAGTGATTGGPKATIEDQVINTARQIAEMEMNRIATQPLVDSGQLPALPPTSMTPPDATGAGGAPLVIPAFPSGTPGTPKGP